MKKFFKYAVPTLLSDRNLPALLAKRSCTFNIATSLHDVELLKNSEHLHILSRYLKTTLYPINIDTIPGDKYTKMTAAHHLLCRMHAGTDSYSVFLSPDTLISNGTLSYFDQAVRLGKQAIIMTGLRVIEEEFTNYNFSYIESRDLAGLAFKHIHPEQRAFIITQEEMYFDPGFFIWPHETTWIIHALYALPIVVSMSNANPDTLGRAVEIGDFVPAAVPDKSLIEFCCDSDLGLLVGVSPRNDCIPHPIMKPTLDNIRARVSRPPVSDWHRYCLTKFMIIHSGTLPPDLPTRLHTASSFIKEVLNA